MWLSSPRAQCGGLPHQKGRLEEVVCIILVYQGVLEGVRSSLEEEGQ